MNSDLSTINSQPSTAAELPPLHDLQQFETRTIARAQIANAPYNPRKIAQANRDKLEKLLTEFGLVETLVWNKRTGNLVGGHQRLSILDTLSDSASNYSLTVSVVDVDEKREKALNVALNTRGAQGEFEKEAFTAVLAELEGEIGANIADLLSNQERKLADLAPLAPPADAPAFNYQQQFGIIITCTDAAEQEATYNTLLGQGYTCKVVVT